jgi:Ni,Fe-hydrogenase III large subunit/Ni,Fe-hydrogenase III component G
MVEEIRKQFPKMVITTSSIRGNTWLIELSKENLPAVLEYAHNVQGGNLLTMVATDRVDIEDDYLIDYVLGWYELGQILVFRAKTRRGEETFNSITPFVPCADWYEREAKESLGLIPVGHPNPRKLLMADDWPDDLFPMRKGFKVDTQVPMKETSSFPFESPENSSMFNIIPYGPYHFAIHEPIYFRFHADGERIVGVDLRAGFNYRGLEKIAESRLTYENIPFIAERVCGICGSVHAEAYSQALEGAAGFEPPERAKWIRVAMLEMERIHSQLLWLGVASHMVGFDTGLMQFWRVRDKIMGLAELLTGNRKQYGMIVPGGVRRDIREDKRRTALQVISEVQLEYEELLGAVLGLDTLKKRLIGVGHLSNEEARKYSVTGPVARASGVSIDVRRDFPYEAYGSLEFKTPVEFGGDVLARTLVRANDVLESIKIMRQVLEALPGGPVHESIDYIPPDVTSVGLVEGPRGTDAHYLITGRDNTVYRWRVRAPTYANLPAAKLMLEGETLADASIIIGSIDPCISCAERVAVVDVRSGIEKIVLGENLGRRLS